MLTAHALDCRWEAGSKRVRMTLLWVGSRVGLRGAESAERSPEAELVLQILTPWREPIHLFLLAGA